MDILSRNKFQPIESIAVSKIYDLLTCPFKVVLNKSITYKIFQPNHQAILGSVIHKIFQYSSRIKDSKDFEKEWTSALNYELEKNDNKLTENFDWHCKDYYLKKELLKNTILKRLQVKFESEAKVVKEKMVSGKYFKGTVDYYLIKGNYLLLKDYKSGKIFSTNGLEVLEIKNEIQAQLMIYCGLICEQHPEITKAEIFVVDNGGKEYQILKTIKECLELLSTSREKLIDTNSQLKVNNYTAIALKNESCKFCNGRYYCPHFNTFLDEGVNERTIDVTGKLLEYTKTNVGFDLKIEGIQSIKQILSLRKEFISSKNLTELLNSQIIVFNTLMSKKDDYIYYGTKNTTIFKSPLNDK